MRLPVWDPNQRSIASAPARFAPDRCLAQLRLRRRSFSTLCHQDSVIGLRTFIQAGTRVTNSVLLGADFYADGVPKDTVPGLGIGRNVVLERTIVDKNACIGDGSRLVNDRGVEHADGPGYYIRGGIIVVPKGGVIPAGTVV